MSETLIGFAATRLMLNRIASEYDLTAGSCFVSGFHSAAMHREHRRRHPLTFPRPDARRT